jgi:1-acyl-sn-glycerol-3-phosphate acyltransferase
MDKKKNYPSTGYMRTFARFVFWVFVKYHGIKKKMPKEVENLKAPYLVIGNHVGFWDPFVVGYFLPHFTQFVSSDAVFRSPVLRFFLTRLGTIPKKKNIKDTKVIRDIAGVISQGGCVGLFPEGVRTWAGNSLKMDISIAKLIKLLNVPVVVSVLKGMNLFHPRWSRKIRKTKMEVEYKILLNTEQIQNRSQEEIFKMITDAISHNEVEYQRLNMNKVRSSHKAEHISHALYVCPECKAIDSFRAKGNHFSCNQCHYDIQINEYAFFERLTKGKLYFDNMLDWYNWQEQWLIGFLYERFDNNYNNVIFADTDMQFFQSRDDGNLEFTGTVDIELFIDRIEIKFKENKETLVFNFDDLQAINAQVNERLEIYYNNKAYRAVGIRPGVSALKWDVAVNAIWKKLGHSHKLSAYIRSY